MNADPPDPEGPTMLQILLRFALGLAAFGLLWRFPEPKLLAIPSSVAQLGQVTRPSLASLVMEVLVGGVAGAVFALAARPLWGDWRYRWQLPALLGLIPAAVIGIQLLVYSGTLTFHAQGAFGATMSFVVSSFSLRATAILLGVALAQGVSPHAEPRQEAEE